MEKIVINKSLLDEMLVELNKKVEKPLNNENYHCSKYGITLIEHIIENSEPLK